MGIAENATKTVTVQVMVDQMDVVILCAPKDRLERLKYGAHVEKMEHVVVIVVGRGKENAHVGLMVRIVTSLNTTTNLYGKQILWTFFFTRY